MFVKPHTLVRRSSALVALALLASGCSIDKSTSPEISAPSGFGMSVTSTASPDTLPRDGQSTSLVRIFARNDQDAAVVGQRFLLSASAGTLSAGDVTTDSSGIATVRFTAPSLNTSVSSATIAVTPVGTLGTVTSGTRTVVIALDGPSVPVAAFAWAPGSPGRLDLVTFDATNTTLDGRSCLESCTYTWNFDDGAAVTGRQVQHRFAETRTYSVKLTVTSSGGTTAESVRSVVVGNPAAITPVITQSPTTAVVGKDVLFDGTSSSAPDGARIVSFVWDFGDKTPTEAGEKIAHTFNTSQSFTIRLTITDETGRTATTTKTVAVAP